MPFSPPPPTLEYLYDYLTRMRIGLTEFEKRSIDHSAFYTHYSSDLDKCIHSIIELQTTIRQTIKFIKNHATINQHVNNPF